LAKNFMLSLRNSKLIINDNRIDHSPYSWRKSIDIEL